MSAERLFFNVFMVFFIWFIYNRYMLTQKNILLAVLFGQLFSFFLSFISMVNNIKASVSIQIVTSVFGIVIPGLIFLYFHINKNSISRTYCNRIKSWLAQKRYLKSKNSEDTLMLGDGSEDILGLSKEVKILSEKHVEDLLKSYDCPIEEIPGSIKDRFVEVQKLLLSKAYRKALETYLVLEKQFNDNASLQFNIGNMYYRLNDYVKAENSYNKALEIINAYEKPKKDDRTSHKTAALRVKNVLKRIEDYEILFNNAVCLLAQGKYEKAIETFRKAGDSKGNWVNIYYPLAVTYEKLEKYPEAVEMYRHLSEIYPEAFEVHRKVGEFLCMMGDFKQAREFIDKAVKLEPEYIEGYIMLGNYLLNNEDYQEAINVYKEVIKTNPELAAVYHNLGTAYYNCGMKEEALEEYKKAIGLNENDYKSYYNLGVILDEIGEKEDAVLRFEHCLDIKPDFHEASNNLAIVLCSLEKYDEAIDTYIKALQYNPTNHELYFNLAMTLECQGREEHAEELYNKIIKMKPDFCDAYFNLASIKCSKGDLKDAEDYLRKVVDCEPGYHKAYYQLARIYAMSREYGRCLDNLDKAVGLAREYAEKAKNDEIFNDVRSLKGFENAVEMQTVQSAVNM